MEQYKVIIELTVQPQPGVEIVVDDKRGKPEIVGFKAGEQQLHPVACFLDMAKNTGLTIRDYKSRLYPLVDADIKGLELLSYSRSIEKLTEEKDNDIN